MKRLAAIGFFVLLGSTSLAQAHFYVSPRVGYVVPTSGDSVFSMGVGVGYGWTEGFATEVSYDRWFEDGSTPNGDDFKGTAIGYLPMGRLTPYATAGAGMLHLGDPADTWDPLIEFGMGMNVRLVRYLSVGVGVTYGVVFDRPDYISPTLGIGASF